MGKVALDIGCGYAQSTLHLLEMGWRVIAIDYYQRPLDRIQKSVRESPNPKIKPEMLVTKKADLQTYDFPDKVDLVLAADVFPYLNPLKLGAIWRKIHACLKSNGRLLGSFFDNNSLCFSSGAWTLDSIDTVKSIITRGPFAIEACQYRVKHYKSSTIEFSLKKIDKYPSQSLRSAKKTEISNPASSVAGTPLS